MLTAGEEQGLLAAPATPTPETHRDQVPAPRGTHFSWNWRNPGLTWGLAFSREVVAKGEAGR